MFNYQSHDNIYMLLHYLKNLEEELKSLSQLDRFGDRLEGILPGNLHSFEPGKKMYAATLITKMLHVRDLAKLGLTVQHRYYMHKEIEPELQAIQTACQAIVDFVDLNIGDRVPNGKRLIRRLRPELEPYETSNPGSLASKLSGEIATPLYAADEKLRVKIESILDPAHHKEVYSTFTLILRELKDFGDCQAYFVQIRSNNLKLLKQAQAFGPAADMKYLPTWGTLDTWRHTNDLDPFPKYKAKVQLLHSSLRTCIDNLIAYFSCLYGDLHRWEELGNHLGTQQPPLEAFSQSEKIRTLLVISITHVEAAYSSFKEFCKEEFALAETESQIWDEQQKARFARGDTSGVYGNNRLTLD